MEAQLLEITQWYLYPKVLWKPNCKSIYDFFLNRQLPKIIDLFLVNLLITVLPYIDSSHIRNFQLSTIKNLQNGKYYKSRHCAPYQTFIWNALGFAQISDWTLTWVLLDVIVRVWFAIRVTGGSSARINFLNPELKLLICQQNTVKVSVPIFFFCKHLSLVVNK